MNQPMIISNTSTFDVSVNSTINLSCGVFSTLPVNFYWIKNNNAKRIGSKQVLTLTNIRYQDGGLYTCVANSSIAMYRTSQVVSAHCKFFNLRESLGVELSRERLLLPIFIQKKS